MSKQFEEIKQILLYKDNGWSVILQNLVKHLSSPYEYQINLTDFRILDEKYKLIADHLINYYYSTGDSKPFEEMTAKLK